MTRARRGHGEKKVAEQRQCDSDRANQQIFPGRFERAMLPMEIDQRRARQSSRFHRDPKQTEMLADRHERHRRQKEQQASSEGGLGRIRKKETFFKVLFGGLLLAAQVSNAVERRREKERGCDAQEQ